MVAGHYQPLADDGATIVIPEHRPTKPVLCSRVRGQRQASWYGAIEYLFNRPRRACLSSASGRLKKRALTEVGRQALKRLRAV